MPHLVSYNIEVQSAIIDAVNVECESITDYVIAAITNSSLIMYSITENGFINNIYEENLFAKLRKICKIRPLGINKDYLIIISDSGILNILGWDGGKKKWNVILSESYGKTGIRKSVPGEYLLIDALGRCIIMGALESENRIYSIIRSFTNLDDDTQGVNELTIKSPVISLNKNRLYIDMAIFSVEFDNPQYAAIEVNLSKILQTNDDENNITEYRYICWYKFDFGLNTIHKLHETRIDNDYSKIIPIQNSSSDNTSLQFLLCGKSRITLYSGYNSVKTYKIPRRIDINENTDTLINTYISHKMANFNLTIVQTIFGDLYRLDINDKMEIEFRYFGTIQTANKFVIIPSGFLFAANTYADDYLYTVASIGDDLPIINQEDFMKPFIPHDTNTLIPTKLIPSLSGVTSCEVYNTFGDISAKQLYITQGTSSSSVLKILQLGTAISEVGSSGLPGSCTGTWAIQNKYDSIYHEYVIISYVASTMILKANDSLEEYNDSSIIKDKQTILISMFFDSTIIQVTQDGWRLIKSMEYNKESNDEENITDWNCPVGRKIIKAVANAFQLLLILNGGSVFYFILDNLTHTLQHKSSKNFGNEIIAIAIPKEYENPYSNYCAIVGVDNQIKLLSLVDNTGIFSILDVCNLPINAYIENLIFTSAQTTQDAQSKLLAGLSNGILYEVGINATSKVFLQSIYKYYVGHNTVKLINAKVKFTNLYNHPNYNGESILLDCIVAVSSQINVYHGIDPINPIIKLVYQKNVSYATTFNSNYFDAGLITICGNELDIISIPDINLNYNFSTTTYPLEYTGRGICIFEPPYSTEELLLKREGQLVNSPSPSIHRPCPIIVIQADNRALSKNIIEEKLENIIPTLHEINKNEDSIEYIQNQLFKRGQSATNWGGALTLINAINGIQQTIFFEDNEAPISVCSIKFGQKSDIPYIAVGTVIELNIKTNCFSAAYIKLFTYNDDNQLYLSHSTEVSDIPRALQGFNGYLLAGIGKYLVLYSFGKQKLLKKSIYKNIPVGINCIKSQNNYIYICDIRHGLHALTYDTKKNTFFVKADQTIARWAIAAEPLDEYTVAMLDKLNEFSIYRVPEDAEQNAYHPILSAELENNNLFVDIQYLSNKTPKLIRICNYNLNTIGISIRKCSLVEGASEIILVTTITGELKVFLPIKTKLELDLLMELQKCMRNEFKSLSGKAHLTHRSGMFPVLNVIDGDLINYYDKLPYAKQKVIANEFDKVPTNIYRILSELKSRIL